MILALLCIASLHTDFETRYRDIDVNRYMAYFADDFSMRSPDGKLHDKAEMTRYQKINAQTTKRVNAYTADVECVKEVDNGDVAVIVLQKYDRDQAPLEQPDKPHNIRSTEELLVGPVFFDGKAK